MAHPPSPLLRLPATATLLLASSATLLAGLVIWSACVLTVRGSLSDVVGDFGLAGASLKQMRQLSAGAVATLLPLLVALAGASGWLLLARPDVTGPAGVQRRRRLLWLVAADGAALLACALAFACTVSWLVDTHIISSATSQAAAGGGGWIPPANVPAAPAAATAAGGAGAAGAAPSLPSGGVGATGAGVASASGGASGGVGIPCPRGCLDMGAWASVLGLPWNCVCLPHFVFGDLSIKLHTMAVQLVVAALSAFLMVAASGGLGMLAAMQYALEAAASSGAGEAAGGTLTEPLLQPGVEAATAAP